MRSADFYSSLAAHTAAKLQLKRSSQTARVFRETRGKLRPGEQRGREGPPGRFSPLKPIGMVGFNALKH